MVASAFDGFLDPGPHADTQRVRTRGSGRNPHSMDSDLPYVALEEADWYAVFDLEQDDRKVQIREIIAFPRPESFYGEAGTEYRGYGFGYLKNGRSLRQAAAKFVLLDPAKIPPHIKKEIDSQWPTTT